MSQLVLGIETSCDDTSIAILKASEDLVTPPVILSHRSFSQETILKEWGGVIPEIAARNHLLKIVPLLKECTDEARVDLKELSLIGVTTYPGLLGPLLTGVNAAKTISLLHKKPILPVNHLFAHLEAISLTKIISYPYLGLLVSGGHGMFLLAHSPTQFTLLGTTTDDAPGEAFDKGGKLLGLGYPAGRIIDTLAKEGDRKRFSFQIGLRNSKDAMLSYSGIKTELRNYIEQNHPLIDLENPSQELKDLCASYQEAIIDAILLKLTFALKKAEEMTHKKLPIVVGGGVACNSRLRTKLVECCTEVNFVAPQFCTDNGAMIANYALRTKELAIAYPASLSIDAKNRFIDKTQFVSPI